MKSKCLLFFSHLVSFIRGRTFRLLKRILILVVLVTAAFAAFEYIVVRVKGYPREMHLMDRQYRTIPIQLEGRTATQLYFNRGDTGHFFTYEIKDLHPMNQWQMCLYPIISKIVKAKEPSLSKIHAEQTLAARNRLIEGNEQVLAEIEVSESDVEIRSLEQEITRNSVRIRALESSFVLHDFEYIPYENPQRTSSPAERLTDFIDRIANSDDPSAE